LFIRIQKYSPRKWKITNKNKEQEVINDKVLILKLKSKQLNNEELTNWLSEKENEYNTWRNMDKCLYIYTSYIDLGKMEFLQYVFNSTKSFDNLFFEGKELKRPKESIGYSVC
jgi:hypothetical protein